MHSLGGLNCFSSKNSKGSYGNSLGIDLEFNKPVGGWLWICRPYMSVC